MPLESPRLILRPRLDADRRPFAELSLDPDVMQYLLPIPTQDAADAWINRQIEHQATHDFCEWAVERTVDGQFIGAVGLMHVDYPRLPDKANVVSFEPCS